MDNNITFTYCDKTISFYLPMPDDHIQNIILKTNNFYEIDVLEEIGRLPLNDGIICDIGANIGNHSVYFSSVLKRDVYAFEPNKIARDILDKNIKVNCLEKKIKVFEVALGAEESQGTMIVNKTNLGASHVSIVPSGNVAIRTLDSFISHDTKVALLKIDVEGFEVDVLKGAVETIKNNNPIIIAETQDHKDFINISKALTLQGYSPLGQKGATNTVFFIHKKTTISNSLLSYLQRVDTQNYNNQNLRRYREILRGQNASKISIESHLDTILTEVQKDKVSSLEAYFDAILAEDQKDKNIQLKTLNEIKSVIETQSIEGLKSFKALENKNEVIQNLEKSNNDLTAKLQETSIRVDHLKEFLSESESINQEKSFTIIANYVKKLEERINKLNKKLEVVYSSKKWRIASNVSKLAGLPVQTYKQYTDKLNKRHGNINALKEDYQKYFSNLYNNNKSQEAFYRKANHELNIIEISTDETKKNTVNLPYSIQLLNDYKKTCISEFNFQWKRETVEVLLKSIKQNDLINNFDLIYENILKLDLLNVLAIDILRRIKSDKEFIVRSFHLAPRFIKMFLFARIDKEYLKQYIKVLIVFKDKESLLSIFEKMIVELYDIYTESELLLLLDKKNITKEYLLCRPTVIDYYNAQPIGFKPIVDEIFYRYLCANKNEYSSVLALFFYNVLINKKIAPEHIMLFYSINKIKLKKSFINSVRRFLSLIKEAKTPTLNYDDIFTYIKTDQDLLYLSLFEESTIKDAVTSILNDKQKTFSQETIAFAFSQFGDNTYIEHTVAERLTNVGLLSEINFNKKSFLEIAENVSGLKAENYDDIISSHNTVLVVLATFNPNIELLKLSIKSILNQTYENIKLAIIDDCSDNSNEIIDLIKDISNKKIVYHRMNNNSGPYKCRNYALEHYNFDFLTFQDDDDVSHPQRIAYELECLISSNAVIVACSNIRFSDTAHVQIDNDGSFFSYGPVTMMIGRNVFEEIGMFKEYKSRGDVEFRKRITRHYGENSYLQLETPLYFSFGSHNTLSSYFEYGNNYSKLQLIREIMRQDQTLGKKLLQKPALNFLTKGPANINLDSIIDCTVSVIMTTYNTDLYVEKAIKSILMQSHTNLELIIVDDCSTDKTRDIISNYAKNDNRVKLYCFGENRGTYFAKNYGMTMAVGSVITFMDSDDISHHKRIETQLEILETKIACLCQLQRKDIHGEIIDIHGSKSRYAPISLMFRKNVLDNIGYFDTVRTSADDEFYHRIKLVYGEKSIKRIPVILYDALLRPDSLTNEEGNAIDLSVERKEGESFLPNDRQNYLNNYQKWHNHCSIKGIVPYMPFPVTSRPFPAEGKLIVANGIYDNNYVSVCLASFPPREKKLKQVINSLLSQVDQIYVYLNDYDRVPEFLKHPKISVQLGRDAYGDLRDNGKMYFMETLPDGYCFTVDDDINYPHDYIEKVIRKIELYERKAVIGIHGTIFAKPFESYFKNRTVNHFKSELKRDILVNQLGTGTIGFHTSLIRPSLNEFYDVGMADVFMAVIAKKMNIPLICIERENNWLTAMEEDNTANLYDEYKNDAAKQTKYISEILPFQVNIPGELGKIIDHKASLYGPAYEEQIAKGKL